MNPFGASTVWGPGGPDVLDDPGVVGAQRDRLVDRHCVVPDGRELDEVRRPGRRRARPPATSPARPGAPRPASRRRRGRRPHRGLSDAGWARSATTVGTGTGSVAARLGRGPRPSPARPAREGAQHLAPDRAGSSEDDDHRCSSRRGPDLPPGCPGARRSPLLGIACGDEVRSAAAERGSRAGHPAGFAVTVFPRMREAPWNNTRCTAHLVDAGSSCCPACSRAAVLATALALNGPGEALYVWVRAQLAPDPLARAVGRRHRAPGPTAPPHRRSSTSS